MKQTTTLILLIPLGAKWLRDKYHDNNLFTQVKHAVFLFVCRSNLKQNQQQQYNKNYYNGTTWFFIFLHRPYQDKENFLLWKIEDFLSTKMLDDEFGGNKIFSKKKKKIFKLVSRTMTTLVLNFESKIILLQSKSMTNTDKINLLKKRMQKQKLLAATNDANWRHSVASQRLNQFQIVPNSTSHSQFACKYLEFHELPSILHSPYVPKTTTRKIQWTHRNSWYSPLIIRANQARMETLQRSNCQKPSAHLAWNTTCRMCETDDKRLEVFLFGNQSELFSVFSITLFRSLFPVSKSKRKHFFKNMFRIGLKFHP